MINFNNYNNIKLGGKVNDPNKRNHSSPHIKYDYIPIINIHANGIENVGATC